MYTAAYTPPDATLPVTATWDNGATGPTAAYSWTTAGWHTLTVTVTNACGWGWADRAVRVEGGQELFRIYLPLVVRGVSGGTLLPLSGHWSTMVATKP